VRWLTFGRGAQREDVAHVTAQIGRVHPRSMAGFRDSIGEHDRRVALAALRGRPCVVVAGARDRLCPLHHSRAIATELPDADLLVYPGVGHMLTYERPDELAAIVRRLAT
jgi:pimeloyl-ACP methyl ester carboxylesterase